MQVLRRCLLLASEYDLEVEALWVPKKENVLAEALSQSEYNRIADLAPALIHISKNNPWRLVRPLRLAHIVHIMSTANQDATT